VRWSWEESRDSAGIPARPEGVRGGARPAHSFLLFPPGTGPGLASLKRGPRDPGFPLQGPPWASGLGGSLAGSRKSTDGVVTVFGKNLRNAHGPLYLVKQKPKDRENSFGVP